MSRLYAIFAMMGWAWLVVVAVAAPFVLKARRKQLAGRTLAATQQEQQPTKGGNP